MILETGKWYRRKDSLTVYECLFAGETIAIAVARWKKATTTDVTIGKEYTISFTSWGYYEEIKLPHIEYFAAWKDTKGATQYEGPFVDNATCEEILRCSDRPQTSYGILKLTHWVDDERVDTEFTIWNNEI